MGTDFELGYVPKRNATTVYTGYLSLRRDTPILEATLSVSLSPAPFIFLVKTELALWRQLILLLTALETPETNEGTIITQNTTRSFVLLRSRDLSCSVTSNVALSHGRPALSQSVRLTIASGRGREEEDREWE